MLRRDTRCLLCLGHRLSPSRPAESMKACFTDPASHHPWLEITPCHAHFIPTDDEVVQAAQRAEQLYHLIPAKQPPMDSQAASCSADLFGSPPSVDSERPTQTGTGKVSPNTQGPCPLATSQHQQCGRMHMAQDNGQWTSTSAPPPCFYTEAYDAPSSSEFRISQRHT